jgi:hypothetical protein
MGPWLVGWRVEWWEWQLESVMAPEWGPRLAAALVPEMESVTAQLMALLLAQRWECLLVCVSDLL